VEFGDGFGIARRCNSPRFFQRHRVRARRVLLPPEGAQLAACNANVRGIDVAVHVEVHHVAVHLLANVVGHVAQAQQVGRLEKGQAVIESQALAGEYLLGDQPQPCVFDFRHSGHRTASTS
jgi:hypothetical protein